MPPVPPFASCLNSSESHGPERQTLRLPIRWSHTLTTRCEYPVFNWISTSVRTWVILRYNEWSHAAQLDYLQCDHCCLEMWQKFGNTGSIIYNGSLVLIVVLRFLYNAVHRNQFSVHKVLVWHLASLVYLRLWSESLSYPKLHNASVLCLLNTEWYYQLFHCNHTLVAVSGDWL